MCWFGDVADGAFVPTDAGRIVEDTWTGLPTRFEQMILDAYVVMPNHFHGIVRLKDGSTSLGGVMRTFKAVSTRLIRSSGMEHFGWHTNYHEHIIRDDTALERIRRYIRTNLQSWENDIFHPVPDDHEPLS
jgi:REP element-mobilizing transposase RayT